MPSSDFSQLLEKLNRPGDRYGLFNTGGEAHKRTERHCAPAFEVFPDGFNQLLGRTHVFLAGEPFMRFLQIVVKVGEDPPLESRFAHAVKPGNLELPGSGHLRPFVPDEANGPGGMEVNKLAILRTIDE